MSKTYDIDSTSIINRDAVIFTISIEDEDHSFHDDFDDPEMIRYIQAEIDAGNEWAWCVVKVTAMLPNLTLEGVDYLGGCSYRSKADFKAGGYYEQMCDSAFNELNNLVVHALEKVQEMHTLLFSR